MFHRIGFASCTDEPISQSVPSTPASSGSEPRKSVVRVHFPARNMTLSYYNDAFDLQVGDIVYVDGKLEGLRGRVVDITYNFKIKLSDYKRVISVADTKVHGEFHFAGSHFVTFDRSALPYEQVITWFKAPEKEDTEIVSEQDGSGFQLNDLQTMKISDAIAERGHDCYRENRVRYISLDKTRVRAIAEGTQPYELECDYIDGEIRNLVCDCFCTYACKHMFAAMLQLKETLTFIEKHYPGRFEESRYFAAVCKETLLNTAMAGRETGSIML
mgnify:CR=1 FL=1